MRQRQHLTSADASGDAQSALHAVLWDMDGTLVDTEPFWLDAEQDLVASVGGTWDPAIVPQLIGRPLEYSAEMLRTTFDLPLPTQEIVDTLIDAVIARMVNDGVPWRPGARELLTALVASEVPCALVTMSWRRMVDVVLEQLPADTFDAVVTGDEVTHGKPHPEPYLRAAEILAVDIAQCVAIEDSTPGVASAEASGAWVLAVEAHVPIPPAPGRSRMKTLTGVDVDLIEQIAAGHTVDARGA